VTDPWFAGADILVLGASGFIGSWVCRIAARHGATVTAAARDPDALAQRLGRFGVIARTVGSDLVVPGSGAELLERVRPAGVLNLVGYGVDREERDEQLAQRLNADLVEELGLALVELGPLLPPWPGPRLVHLGSAFEYGSVTGPVSEGTPCGPTTTYGRTKLEGTQRLSELRDRTGLLGVTLRVATVYGPGEHPHRLLPTLIRSASDGETISLTQGEQERDFTYVEDVAEGVVRMAAATGSAGPVMNLATGKLQTVRSFATCARDMLGIPPERVIFGALPYRDDEVWQGKIDVHRLEAVLGWKPSIPVPEGIERTIAWGRNERSDGDQP
jgi:UDP-glucose 4-epimerase